MRRGADLERVDLELTECVGRYQLDEQMEDKEIAEAITRFLKELDEFSRIVFLRRYWHLESIADLAERLKVSESKIKSNLFRTRKALRKKLQEEGVAV